jgi:hypothetical protein
MTTSVRSWVCCWASGGGARKSSRCYREIQEVIVEENIPGLHHRVELAARVLHLESHCQKQVFSVAQITCCTKQILRLVLI